MIDQPKERRSPAKKSNFYSVISETIRQLQLHSSRQSASHCLRMYMSYFWDFVEVLLSRQTGTPEEQFCRQLRILNYQQSFLSSLILLLLLNIVGTATLLYGKPATRQAVQDAKTKNKESSFKVVEERCRSQESTACRYHRCSVSYHLFHLSMYILISVSVNSPRQQFR